MRLRRGGYTYIMTNAHHNVLYVGVTSDLEQRMERHAAHFFKNSFTARYNCEQLVYLERHPSINEAILRERQIKKYSRKKKEALINALNPDWKNLLNDLGQFLKWRYNCSDASNAIQQSADDQEISPCGRNDG